MAGAHIDVVWDNADVIRAFQAAIKQIEDTTTLFEDIGESLILWHQERWHDEVSPDGTPWEPLSDKYKARKKKNADKILVLEGFLRDHLSYLASNDDLLFGSNAIQAASMHFGDDTRGIPERPNIGLSEDDKNEIATLMKEHLADAL